MQTLFSAPVSPSWFLSALSLLLAPRELVDSLGGIGSTCSVFCNEGICLVVSGPANSLLSMFQVSTNLQELQNL